MLLLTMEETSGYKAKCWTGGERRDPEKRPIAFATRLPLGLALDEIKRYERIFADKYESSFVEFRLIGVSTIMNVDTRQLLEADVRMVERMCKSLLGIK